MTVKDKVGKVVEEAVDIALKALDKVIEAECYDSRSVAIITSQIIKKFGNKLWDDIKYSSSTVGSSVPETGEDISK